MNPYEFKLIKSDTCWYCGVSLNDTNRSEDHFWPAAYGGQLKISCCKACNTLKGNLTPNQFIKLLNELRSQSKENGYKYSRMIRATSSLWERIKYEV